LAALGLASGFCAREAVAQIKVVATRILRRAQSHGDNDGTDPPATAANPDPARIHKAHDEDNRPDLARRVVEGTTGGRQLPEAIDQHAWLDPRNGVIYPYWGSWGCAEWPNRWIRL
jgi:hypothetical protein